MATIEIKGLDKVISKIENLAQLKSVKTALKAAALHVKGKVSTYPPASIANSPGQPRWYERGYGPKWIVRDGSIRSRKSSETLGRRWTTEERAGGMSWAIGNNVSYAPYVHDADRQTGFHKARGWKTDEQIAREESDEITGFVVDHIKKEIDS